MRTILALLLLVEFLAGCNRATPASSAKVEPLALHFNVTGMMCEGCEQAITDTVAALPGVVEVKAAHATGEVDVRTTDPSQRVAIAAAIENLNYEVTE